MAWEKKRRDSVPLVFSGCLKKQAFEEWEAFSVANKMPGATAYRCDFCFKWHLTRNLRTKSNAERVAKEAKAAEKAAIMEAAENAKKQRRAKHDAEVAIAKAKKMADSEESRQRTRQRLISLGLLKE
jgi:hypothetical protein